MKALPVIAAAGLAVAAVLVVVAGARVAAPPEALSPSVPAASNQDGDDLRWHRSADQNGGRQARPATSEPIAEQPAAPKPALPPIVPPARSDSPPTPSRAIQPSVIAIPQVAPEELERVGPRPPLSQSPQARPPKKDRPKPLLFRPVAEAAGIIAAGGRTLTIAGVEPLADSETCKRATGGEWPCGRAARTAFRGLLRGRAVTCDFPEGDVPEAVTVACSVGRRDIGAWLVENGWARAADDTYLAAARTARAAGRGIYGPGPASLPALPSATADTLEPASGAAADGGEIGTVAEPGSISILPPAALEPDDAAATVIAPDVTVPDVPAPDVTDPDAAFPPPPAPPVGVSPLPPPSSPRP